MCRVRHHDDVARIELSPDESVRAWRPRPATHRERTEAAGYRYVTLDVQGYRTGSLNEGVRLRPV